MPDPKLAQFGAQKYISLETFKKNGQGVKTPVWFVLQNDAFYVYTEADSWKVKRIRNNPRVRVANKIPRCRVANIVLQSPTLRPSLPLTGSLILTLILGFLLGSITAGATRYFRIGVAEPIDDVGNYLQGETATFSLYWHMEQ